MKAPNDLSFLPDDYLENKAQRRANVICAILFLVTMVTIGMAFTTGERLVGANVWVAPQAHIWLAARRRE